MKGIHLKCEVSHLLIVCHEAEQNRLPNTALHRKCVVTPEHDSQPATTVMYREHLIPYTILEINNPAQPKKTFHISTKKG